MLMYNIKGFYRQSRIADNNAGVVATFGELSRQSSTYSVEDRNYKFQEYPNTELVTMQVVNDLSQPAVITDTLGKKITAVGEWLYQQHVVGSIPANNQIDQFYASIRTEFAELNWISIGNLVRSAQNGYYMPTHVEFTVVDSGNTYNVKIWLADINFQNEYEPYTTHIIPPVDSVDQFINNTATMMGLLAANTPARVMGKYNVIRGKNPETRFDTFNLTWHDPNDSSSTIETSWAYIAYGAQGSSIDNIKIAIRDYLTANGPTTNWENIFPSLYQENDFTIIPLWDKIAVPQTQLDQNLYGSYTKIKDLYAMVKSKVPSTYGSTAAINTHVTNFVELFGTFYRGMIFAAVGNPNNIDSIKSLSMLYPDYSMVGVSDPDFERMEEDTRDFCELLNSALEKARIYRSSDSVPTGFYRLARDNRIYLAFIHKGFQYFILTRESFYN